MYIIIIIIITVTHALKSSINEQKDRYLYDGGFSRNVDGLHVRHDERPPCGFGVRVARLYNLRRSSVQGAWPENVLEGCLNFIFKQ